MIARKGFLIISASLLLAACGAKQPEIADTTKDTSLQEQTNTFLEQNDIVLPEGAERINLAGEDGSGIATREVTDKQATFTVLADLPEPTLGQYMAWVDTADGQPMSLGIMSAKKGGYVLEKTVSGAFEGTVTVQVSRESGQVTAPSDLVLSGEFK